MNLVMVLHQHSQVFEFYLIYTDLNKMYIWLCQCHNYSVPKLLLFYTMIARFFTGSSQVETELINVVEFVFFPAIYVVLITNSTWQSVKGRDMNRLAAWHWIPSFIFWIKMLVLTVNCLTIILWYYIQFQYLHFTTINIYSNIYM